MKTVIKVSTAALVLFVAGINLVMGGIFVVELPFRLVAGWVIFLVKTIPLIKFDVSILVGGVGTVLLLLFGTHRFLVWLHANRRSDAADTSTGRQWPFRWTLVGMTLFALMFVASVAITGLVHQVGWLAQEPLVDSGDWRETFRRIENTRGALRYHQHEHQHFPVTEGSVAMEDVDPVFRGPETNDSWGTPLRYWSDGKSYVIRSYGPNRVLGGGGGKFDDIVYADGVYLSHGF